MRAIIIGLVISSSASLVLAGVFASRARADVAPPPGYVENCTLERTCPVGTECVLCPADYHDSADDSACSRNLGPLGFAKQCRSAGGSVWDEVWCRPVSRDATTQPDPPDGSVGQLVARATVCQPKKDEGCSCSTAGAGGHGLGAGQVMISALLGLALRRHRLQLTLSVAARERVRRLTRQRASTVRRARDCRRARACDAAVTSHDERPVGPAVA